MFSSRQYLPHHKAIASPLYRLKNPSFARRPNNCQVLQCQRSVTDEMVCAIALMIILDAMHSPAVATSLSFALKAGNVSNLVLLGLAIRITAVLVGLERYTLWLLAHYSHK
ncbi:MULTISPECIES: HPP family protein [unclassified Nostoc]|uniref:HPP family protein n=1 Tax=unclassified Nostoc TaxID=2593658 RepID=UPI001F54B3CB|nr:MULTISPECIES: HPP family protein [unclassified Nostoc]